MTALASRRRLGDEGGETLIELLVTIIVLSIGAVAVVSAMTSSVLAADAHRSLATGEVALRSYTEAVINRASTVGTPGGPPFEACPAAATLQPVAGTYALPAGWTGSITQVEYWIPGTEGAGGSFSNDSTGACTDWVAAICPGAPSPACSPGLVRLRLSVHNPNLTAVSTETMRGTVIVRRGNGP